MENKEEEINEKNDYEDIDENDGNNEVVLDLNKPWPLSTSFSVISKNTRNKRKMEQEDEEESQNIKKKKVNSFPQSRTRFHLLNKIVQVASYRHSKWPAKTIGLEGICAYIRNHETRTSNTQLVQFIGNNQLGWIEPSKILPIEDFQSNSKSQKVYEEALQMKNEEENAEEYKTWEEELIKEKTLLKKKSKFKLRSKDNCTKCSGDGNLFPCSNCNSYYHSYCAGLTIIPEEEWLCPLCTSYESSDKKKNSIEGISKHIKPKLKEIPALNGKKVYCGSKQGRIEKANIVSYLLEKNITLQSRAPTSKPAKPFSSTEHLPNCKPVRKFHINDFNSEIFKEYLLEKKEPLVITNFMTKLKKDLWTVKYLQKSSGTENVSVRYMEFDKKDESQFLILNDAVKNLDWYLENASSEPVDDPDFQNCIGKDKTVRMYAKDFPFGDLIPEWKCDLIENLPKEIIPNGEHDIFGYLPMKEIPFVWMGYFGAEGTRTPLHVDKVATIAFNLCFAVQKKGAKHWWFIDHTEKEKLAAKIESEKGCLYLDDFWMAPTELEELGLKMWYHKQELDHLVIVPPTVPHTVLNTGGLSFAVAGNVLNIDSIEDAWIVDQENRRRKISGIYRFKSAIYHALLTESKKIESNKGNAENLSKLAKIFSEILKEEVCKDKKIKFFQSKNLLYTCDECKADIFNRYFSCSRCEYDLCLQCYEKKKKPTHCHSSSLQPFQKWEYKELEQLLKTVNDYLNRFQ